MEGAKIQDYVGRRVQIAWKGSQPGALGLSQPAAYTLLDIHEGLLLIQADFTGGSYQPGHEEPFLAPISNIDYIK